MKRLTSLPAFLALLLSLPACTEEVGRVLVVTPTQSPATGIAQPTAAPTLESTVRYPAIDTAFGTLEVGAAEVVDKYCRFYGCRKAKRGYKLLVVKFNVVEGANGDHQDKLESLCEATYVATPDGTRGECASSAFTVTPQGLSFLELVFTLPEPAEGFTLHTAGNDPIVLPTPSAAATATPSS